ncbi:MAG: Gfo/Idh/MocA family oxidoreductase [Candidatus Hydrogenedentes bacterium]|nr:Gfo/Idh/MocA family oxidoreductase [Candidatus Hydrogenedentota bacterium]
MRTRLSRRTFLKGAAALAVGPTILPASVFGQNAPSNRITMGIIGCGGRGRNHCSEIYHQREQVQLLAYCDVNAAHRAKMHAMTHEMYQNDDRAEYNDFRELIARDDIDAVSIAVPDHWHALIAVAAARAGKHLYSEKPLAYSIVEGRAMVDAVKESKVVFQHGTQQRSAEQYRHACDLALNGYLGAVHTYKVGSPFGIQGGSTAPAPVPEGLDYDLWLGPAPFHEYTDGRCSGDGGVGWYHIRDYSGGWITAWGSHDLDIPQWANGTDHTGPVEVEGRAEFAANGVYDTAWKWHVESKYADGKKLIYTSEDENPHGIRIEGSDGWVFVNRVVIKAEPESLLKIQFKPEDKRVAVSDSHFGNFFDCIRNGGTPVAHAEAAHRSTTIGHLCNIAARTGRKVQWDPEKEQIVGDEEQAGMLARPMRAPWKI